MRSRIDSRTSGFVGVEAANADSVRGLGNIAAALDRGLVDDCRPGVRLTDLAAIVLGWVLLIGVIRYPELQLAAIALCILVFALRPLGRLILGPGINDAALLRQRGGY
jgi:hypothetical protein